MSAWPARARDRLAARADAFVVVGLAVTLVFVSLAVTNAGGQRMLWENAHWTVSALVAVLLCALGVLRSSGLDRSVRVALLAGLVSYAVGQLLWDLQVAVGAVVVPAPSSFFFILPVVPVGIAVYRAVHGRVTRQDEIAVYLDAATVYFAITALVLAIWGDAGEGVPFFRRLALVAYPVVYVASAVAAFVAALALRAKPEPRGTYPILVGTLLLGVTSTAWLPGALGDAGAALPLGPLFSIAIMIIGYGAGTWTSALSDDRRYDRFARVLLGALPGAAIALATTLLVVYDDGLPGPDFGPAEVAAGLTLLLAVVRQSRLLWERERSIERETRAREQAAAALDRLAETEERYRTLIEQVPAVVYLAEGDDTVSNGSRLIYVSPQVRSLLGYEPSALVDDPELWTQLLHPDDFGAAVDREAAHFASGGPLEHEYRLARVDGSHVWVRDEAVILADAYADARLSHGVLTDITERKRLETELRHQAFHDSLTGLANRALFSDRVEHALAQRPERGVRTLAVLFLDIDDFKTVNDSLGHGAGDELLIQVASRIAQTVRVGDSAARLGGDEFGILLEDVDGAAADATAERILESISPGFTIHGRELSVGASIGIAVGTPGEDEAASLLRDADAAMYLAKSRGKGRVAFFEPSIHLEAVARLQSRADLQRALDQDEFYVEYQPIYDLRSGELAAFEALVRWQRPGYGTVRPDEFIPLAEETGLIVPLGRWVLDEACVEATVWDTTPSGRPLAVSINLSPRQLLDERLLDHVETVLAYSGLMPRQLILEITESGVVRDLPTAVSVLEGLRGLGVRIAIDDFGTGYSSLSYLSRLPVDILKVDRAFVSSLESSKQDAALVQAVVKIGQILDLEIVAEGVETKQQLQRLRRLGCPYAQGYLFSPAVPAAAARALLQEANATAA